MSGTATRRRSWPEVPTDLRQEAEGNWLTECGTSGELPGGFTPGLAGIVVCADGTEAFVKATPIDGPGAADYRREAVIAGGLPDRAPAPRLRFAAERAGWLMLCFDVAPGHTAQEPWDPAELAATTWAPGDLSGCQLRRPPGAVKRAPMLSGGL